MAWAQGATCGHSQQQMDWTVWITSAKVGSAASVIGVCLSLIGFAITFWNVYVSRRAAERAEVAANEARKAARLFDTVQELAMALSAPEVMSEILELARRQALKADEAIDALLKELA